jgi:hypothetical protein
MNKNIISILCASGIVLGSALTVMGAGFQSIGYQATSMGGAGVAYSSGAYAAYYNPALLATRKNGVEVTLSPRVGYREHNLADHIDALADLDIEGTLDELSGLEFDATSLVNSLLNGTPVTPTGPYTGVKENLQTIQTELRALSRGNGLELMPGATLGVQVRNFGFGVYGLSDISATAVVDENRLGIIVPVEANNTQYYVEYNPDTDVFTARSRAYYESNSLKYALEHKTTKISLTGVAYLEIPLAMGYQVKTAGGSLNIGGAFKIMSGRTYKIDKDIDSKSGDLTDEIDDSEKKTTTFGLDAGVLYIPDKLENLSLGMVIKNINNPKFDVIDGSQLVFKPQARIGAAYTMLLDSLTFAMDMDLTNNESLLPGFKERYIGGGLDFHPVSWFSGRAGLMKNLEESSEGIIYTLGLGFGAKWFQLDVAGQYSTEKGSFDGHKMPRYGSVQATFISKWF